MAPIPRVALDAADADERLLDAASRAGFVTVVNHGVPPEVVNAACTAADEFFALPAEAKHAVTTRRFDPTATHAYRGYFPSSVNGKEGFDLGEPELPSSMTGRFAERNHFPDVFAPVHRTALASYFAAMADLGERIIRSLVAKLGGAADRVASAFVRPRALSTLRLNLYPAHAPIWGHSAEDGAPLACEEHVDSGFVTIVHQDQRGGLEVRGDDGTWRPIDPDPGGFVVNTGLALRRITNDRLAATRHRVRHADKARRSIPFFVEPHAQFVVAPSSFGLPGGEEGAPTYEAFLAASLAKFAEYAGPPEERLGRSTRPHSSSPASDA
ncbi:MAG: 2OG-Fe(II) oxygenase family protein [Deltaproteobacteria bacterium]